MSAAGEPLRPSRLTNPSGSAVSPLRRVRGGLMLFPFLRGIHEREVRVFPRRGMLRGKVAVVTGASRGLGKGMGSGRGGAGAGGGRQTGGRMAKPRAVEVTG